MFKPNITVATVVQAEEHFLIVTEFVNGKATWNQPAGHLEANETLLDAATRELYEETGIQAAPHYLLNIHQWIAPDKTAFIRFLFGLDLSTRCETDPQDSDIDHCLWVTKDDILNSDCLRSPLVSKSIHCYLSNPRLPLDILQSVGSLNQNDLWKTAAK